MNKITVVLRTAQQLGLFNIFSVLFYRVLLKSRLIKFLFPHNKIRLLENVYDVNIKTDYIQNNNEQVTKVADDILKGKVFYYSYHRIYVGNIPNWFLNPFSNIHLDNQKNHWAEIEDFNFEIGDIKNVWEISRFNWLGTLAYAYKNSGKEKYLNKLNIWIKDWVNKNPMNTGPNWKCGQESSIRAINILIANEIIDNNKISSELIEILIAHISRISPTTFYAKAQDNNHGISEGIALFLLGYVLWQESKKHKYLNLHKKGIKLLENRVQKLIMKDGTFSQYSIVYHRMILDLLSICELFRQRWNLEPFSIEFYKKCGLAIAWYAELIDKESGNAPNIGANDGTYLFNYDLREYRDFRPSLVLASTVFNIPVDKSFETDHCLLNIFILKPKFVEINKNQVKNFNACNFLKLNRECGATIMRVPNYKFRPSHSDALHLDIWQDGINWVRDAGSYSYAISQEHLDNYSGTKAHSTIEFDGQNQMPRISRFLFGNWLSPISVVINKIENSMKSGYMDYKYNYHHRSVKETDKGWQIIDKINGNYSSAKLRWFLNPGEWIIKSNSISYKNTTMVFKSNQNIEIQIMESYESLYYMEKTTVPVLTIDLGNSRELQTQILFQ